MAPWGQIALENEQMFVHKARCEIERHPQLQLVGEHVDCAFFLRPLMDESGVTDKLLESHAFPSGEPMFHLKQEPVCKVPTWPQKQNKWTQQIRLEKPVWKVVLEHELEDLVEGIAQLWIQHKGFLLTGPAGVGKTYIIRRVMDRLEQLFPQEKQIVSALRHCAAMLVEGKTIQHYINKYKAKGGCPKADTRAMMDEISEIQLHTWAQLAQWKLMGTNFMLLGDLDGQFKPIFDRWDDAMKIKDLRTSRFLHEMAGGLHIKLTVYRRGTDPMLFQSYTDLYPYADDKREGLAQFLAEKMGTRYPWDYAKVDLEDLVGFVASHVQRIRINELVNAIVAKRKDEKLFLDFAGKLPGVAMQPQPMHIWKGMELLCYSRKYVQNKPVNGCVYVVEGWDDRSVTVSLHQDYRRREEKTDAQPPKPDDPEASEEEEDPQSDPEDLGEEDEGDAAEPPPAKKAKKDLVKNGVYKLTHKQAVELMRPQHALVYASIQGRTLRAKHLALMDVWKERYFSVRHLIVAVSRATHGQFVHVLSAEDQAELMTLLELAR